MKATLKQIAKELGVSVSTVSKSLSDSPEISEPTKIRIQEYAKLHNYKPNSIAKNLKSRKSYTIGVIVPNILNPFFAKVFTGIEKVAQQKGYNVITVISNESTEKEKYLIETLNNGSIDGIIVSIAEESQAKHIYNHFESTIKSGTPIVMFDRVSDEVLCDKVVVDDYDSAFSATEFLIQSKAKKIGFLTTIDNLSVGKLRLKGYQDALEKHKIPIDKSTLINTNELENFDKALLKLIQSKKCDALFAADEHSATMAHKIALKEGVKIPKELSIIGFADGVWSRRLTPSLSTVSQHAPEIGEKAAHLLIKRIEKKPEELLPFTTEIIKTELRYRETTNNK